MFLKQSVRSVSRVSRNALSSSDVHKSPIARRMCLLGHIADGLQLLLGIDKTLIPPLDVVIDLNPKHTVFLRASDNALRIVASQPISSDAHVVCPILFRRIGSSLQRGLEQQKDNDHRPRHGPENARSSCKL